MTDEEFDRLATLYLEDALDDGGRDQLSRALLNSTDRVQQFNDLRMLAGLIIEHGRSEADLPEVVVFHEEEAARRGQWGRWAAAAAILMFGLFAGFHLSEEQQGSEGGEKAPMVSTILMDFDFENATEESLEGIPKVPGRWGGNPLKLVSSENSDVPPKKGKSSACLTLPGSPVPNATDREPKRAIQWRIVDLPDAGREEEPMVVELCVEFNRDAEVPDPTLACRVELYSFKGLPETAESQLESEGYLAAAINHFETDSDPQTWETAVSQLLLSPDANFLLLGISGYADRIPQPRGGERYSGHHADGVQLKLTSSNKN